jgi:hypothetical protein
MLVRAGNTRRGLVLAVLLTGALAGCTEAEDENAKPQGKTTASAPADATSAASAGGSVGATGSACELPVIFAIAANWTPEAVDAPLRQGPVTLACEVDAKPAGHIGYLRAWTAAPGDADAQLVYKG